MQYSIILLSQATWFFTFLNVKNHAKQWEKSRF